MKGWRLFYQNPQGLTLNERMERPKFAFIFYSSYKKGMIVNITNFAKNNGWPLCEDGDFQH